MVHPQLSQCNVGQPDQEAEGALEPEPLAAGEGGVADTNGSGQGRQTRLTRERSRRVRAVLIVHR